ncbi:siderophore-interacting protein [Phaeobacter sp. B1627]|uniref:siderophore-interacting protein n=1 Tax=Phaeobacter sp. B1627 TaxID=2583809 RepID=UPI0011198525|nr:siderophore-interacting protein [Phaeobacter sp. B1627]TNJ47482.1 siderophore-interacting protein [Phaeobacter sp. B1627]
MSMQDRFSFDTQSRLPGLPFATVRTTILSMAKEHDLPLITNTDQEIQIETAYGNYSFVRQGADSSVLVGSTRADWLYVLKESLSDTIAHLSPDTASKILWSDAGDSAGCLPPNFQFITVQDVSQLPGGFLRVVCQAEDLAHFTTDAIHFRLALPAPDLAYPEWPYQSETGATVWPKGAASLHRPVYTVRDLNAESGRLVFDIFEHDGGRATEWARSVTPGSRVGLTGPGGGGIPQTESITIYSDETGFPAVARILAALPPTARGRAVLEHTCPDSKSYPLPDHAGIEVIHHPADSGQDLGDVAIAEMAAFADHMIWFASEKSATQKLRAQIKACGINSKDHYIAAYWTRPASSGTQA